VALAAELSDPDPLTLERIMRSLGGFGHREHLELAWSFLRRYPVEVAASSVVSAIRHAARLHGGLDRYHETRTRAWVRLVALRIDGAGAGDSFDAFIAVNPGLPERGLLERHYSPALLHSEPARAAWAEPDLRAFPAHAVGGG
jgi:hypothetical protein